MNYAISQLLYSPRAIQTEFCYGDVSGDLNNLKSFL